LTDARAATHLTGAAFLVLRFIESVHENRHRLHATVRVPLAFLVAYLSATLLDRFATAALFAIQVIDACISDAETA